MKTKRILVKISGEGLSEKADNRLIDERKLQEIASQIKTIHSMGVEIGIVVGGGNFWRGNSNVSNYERNAADYIGMLATIMNGIALKSVFEQNQIPVTVFSSLVIDEKVCSFYSVSAVLECFRQGKVAIFVGGTGRPFFTTDTCTALCASEIGADIILVGKHNVDGVYDKDPAHFPDAQRFASLSFKDLITKNLQVMDLSSATLLQNSSIVVYVFDVRSQNAFVKALEGTLTKTVISRDSLIKFY